LEYSEKLTPAVKQQLLGEAKFIRAFCYFYLVNNFGNVPLALTTDYKLNTSMSRNPEAEVYSQMINDLKEAEETLSSNFLNGNLRTYATNAERVRPTKWAAAALLARVYLYTKDYANAEIQSTLVINNTAQFNLSPLNGAFLKNNKEAIWQLQPTTTGWNTEDARVFVINRAPGNSKPVYLDSNLVKAFEANDARKVNWIKDTTIEGEKYFFPYKYRSATLNSQVTEYFMVLRLAEQYLIRAEARAQLNDIGGAQTDLNTIRTRAGLPGTNATNIASLLAAIMQERRIELFSELGHRWYDLKRTNSLNSVMAIATPLKGGTWEITDELYPLPLLEIERNINLTQNFGY
jgi:hypothetical protein